MPGNKASSGNESILMNFAIVTPWHNPTQRDNFLRAWNVNSIPDWLILQHDANGDGCAATKNAGIRKAMELGAEVVVILDDDCYPTGPHMRCYLEDFAYEHIAALRPQAVELYKAVTNPPSRGTPYYRRTVTMPVAASMGFWENVPDLCAPAQLVRGPNCAMEFDRRPVFGQAFAYSGMNVAFRTEWWPWCSFIDLPRVDDIFAGYLFQREAYRRKHCFNLDGPTVRHSRQSNVWKNLQHEAKYLERNETLWSDILLSDSDGYDELKRLIPAAV
jgi:hypothetical protein